MRRKRRKSAKECFFKGKVTLAEEAPQACKGALFFCGSNIREIVVSALFPKFFRQPEFHDKIADIVQIAVERAFGDMRVAAKSGSAYGFARMQLVKEKQQNFRFAHFVLAGDSADP